MNAKARAQRMAGNLYGVLIDYEKEMPEVIVSFFTKEIRADRRETMERCATICNGYKRISVPKDYKPKLDNDSRIAYHHADRIAEHIRALIEQLEEE